MNHIIIIQHIKIDTFCQDLFQIKPISIFLLIMGKFILSTSHLNTPIVQALNNISFSKMISGMQEIIPVLNGLSLGFIEPFTLRIKKVIVQNES
jgi:hypothetical protein